MQGRMKTVICYFLSVFCCTACSLDIPYENQFSDPDAITTPPVSYTHLDVYKRQI